MAAISGRRPTSAPWTMCSRSRRSWRRRSWPRCRSRCRGARHPGPGANPAHSTPTHSTSGGATPPQAHGGRTHARHRVLRAGDREGPQVMPWLRGPGGVLGPAWIRGVRRPRPERRDAASAGRCDRGPAARADDRHRRHTWLGVVHLLFDWDWAAAERELQEALQPATRTMPTRSSGTRSCWPSCADTARACGGCISPRRSNRSRPRCGSRSARCYYYARRYQEALENLQEHVAG